MSDLQGSFAARPIDAAFPTSGFDLRLWMSDLQRSFGCRGTAVAFPTSEVLLPRLLLRGCRICSIGLSRREPLLHLRHPAHVFRPGCRICKVRLPCGQSTLHFRHLDSICVSRCRICSVRLVAGEPLPRFRHPRSRCPRLFTADVGSATLVCSARNRCCITDI